MVRNIARTLRRQSLLLGWLTLLILGAALLVARPASSQELDADELEDLVAPVALYPDDVLGIILPASTFPLDIVRAARFLEDREEDASLEPDPEWDDSIVALLNYPEVLRMMDENIDWTWELGEAVLTDQAAVLNAAQDFRSRALAAGNLQSDDRQTVATENGTITIAPADPKVVYIPIYEPREVVVYHSTPIWHYYPIGYPVYYYPYPYGYSFNVGFFWGVTSYFSIGWHSHYVHVHHHTHHGHPYYLNSYYSYAPYYPRNHVNVTLVVNDYDNVWVPSPRRGGRPEMVSVEGRTSAARMARTATVEGQASGAPRASTARLRSAQAPETGDATVERPSTAARPSTTERPSTAERPSTRQSATTSGSTSTTRMTAPQSTRPSPQTSGQSAPQTSNRPAPQTSNRPSTRSEAQSSSPPATQTAPRTSTRSAPPASSRPAPQAPTTRSAPQVSSRPAPQASSRPAPQTSSRPAPRSAPQTSSRPSPQTSTRAAPPSSAQRSMSSGQSSSGGPTRSGSR